MTREELIQSPEYWRTLYENECERLGIKPILTFLPPIDEDKLGELARESWEDNDYIVSVLPLKETDVKPIYTRGFEDGYRKAMEDKL